MHRKTAASLIAMMLAVVTYSSSAAAAVPWTFFLAGDSRTNQNIWEINARTMAALDPDAVMLFKGGDVVQDGTRAQWVTHFDHTAAAAPDP